MEPHELSNLREKYGAHHSPEKLRAMYIQSELGFSVQDSIERLSGMAAEFAGWLTHDDYNLDYHYRNAFNPAEQELAKALVDVVNGRIEPEAPQPPPAVPLLPEWARRIPDHPSMVVAANFGQFLDILKQLPSPLRKRLQLGDSILTILDVLMQAGWIKLAGRREVPGRPVIYATTPEFLVLSWPRGGRSDRWGAVVAPPVLLLDVLAGDLVLWSFFGACPPVQPRFLLGGKFFSSPFILGGPSLSRHPSSVLVDLKVPRLDCSSIGSPHCIRDWFFLGCFSIH